MVRVVEGQTSSWFETTDSKLAVAERVLCDDGTATSSLAPRPGVGGMNDAVAGPATATSTPDQPCRRELLSIVMPARNEEQNLPRAYEELSTALAGLDCDYEVIVIDNDSSDDTPQVAEWLCARDARWR